MSTLRRVLLAGAVLVGAIGIVGSIPDVAHAATCKGRSCNGKNPANQGCAADAQTVNSATYFDRAAGGTFSRMTVQLRYSRTCNASWSRVIVRAGGTANVTTGRAYMEGFRSSTTLARFTNGTVFSLMRTGSSVGACGRANFNNGAVVVTRCTSAG